MQSTVSCDHVFDVLTRQPFPTGADDDAAVEEHIRSCHECRRLAEALRPAVNLVHESMEHASRINGFSSMKNESDLPRFSGLVDEPEEQSVDRIMEQVRLAAGATTETKQTGWRPGSLIGVACLAAAALAMFVTTQPKADGCEDLTNNTERFEYLRRAGVPLNCLSGVGWNCPVELAEQYETPGFKHWASAARCSDCHETTQVTLEQPKDERPQPKQPDANACCTDCHNAAEPLDRMDNFKPLAQSCLACHSS